MSEKNNFRFWVPLSEIKKGKDKKGNEIMKLGGIASTKTRDSDGEILNPNGFDLTYFRTRGHVNWNHSKEPTDIVGEVAKAEVRKEGLWVESELFPNSKRAKQIYELAQTLQKDSNKLRLGYSIEGKVVRRDPTDESKVQEAFISAVAITPCPKNPDSIVDIIKGDYKGWSDEEKPPVAETIDLDELQKSLAENIIDITRPDGKRVTVDGNYNVKIQKSETTDDDEEEDENEKKALTTASGAAVIPEHVDGETKEMLNGAPQPKIKKAETDTEPIQGLTEEEVIYRIMKSNSVISFEKAHKIFQTLNKLTMAKTGTTQISDDLLEKSLAKLGFKKSHEVKKAEKEVGGEEEEDYTEEEEDEDEGGKEPAGKNKKPGLKVKTPLKKGNSIKKKYDHEDEDVDDPDPEEEDRDEEGDEDEEVDEPVKRKKGMKKAVKPNIRKSVTAEYINNDVEELVESVDELKDMVKSLAVISKHSYDLVKSQADEISELKEQLEAFGDAPASGGRKSIVKKAVERDFQKGMGGDDTLEKGEDGTVRVDVDRAKNQVLNMMDHMTFGKGNYNEQMAKGMSLFEASSIITPDIQKAIENEFKVKLVRTGR